MEARSDLIQIEKLPESAELVPSRFNVRTLVPDGTMVIYNSYTGAFTGFPPSVVPALESLLHKAGFTGLLQGLTKYLFERGYLVRRNTNELDRVRLLFGKHQYRNDELELILLTSEECNFRCAYCYETFPRATMEPWVREAIITLFCNRAPRLNRFSVSYFGGEPLLGLEAIEQVAPVFQETCDQHGIRFSSDMTTNGYLLTPNLFGRLLRWRIKTFQITVDGTPEDHNRQRTLKGGGETFSTIFNNLMGIKDVRGDFRIILRMNFNQHNAEQVDAFLDTFSPFQNDRRFVLRFYPVGKWGGPNDDRLEVCGLSGERERQKLTVLASDRGYSVETRMPYIQARGALNVCYAARPYNLIIGADGKIMKCTIALDTRDYNVVGHLTREGRAEIDVDKFTKWVKPYFEEDTVCKKCHYVPVCQGFSCPIPRIETGERPCPGEKNEIHRTLASIWHIQQNSGRYQRLESHLEPNASQPSEEQCSGM
ncbi:MAG TPA: radical SAM protein [Terriglobia bacterium]|nr:radical SAM protein [Terriglobia bacterium]